jgi:hypothetical protein
MKSRINALGVTSKAARLKVLMPEIDRKVSQGVKHEDIVQALAEDGLTVSLATFRTNLYRYRRQSGQDAPEQAKVKNVMEPQNEFLLHQNSPPLISDGDFEAAMDHRNRDELANQYLNRRKPIMRSKV